MVSLVRPTKKFLAKHETLNFSHARSALLAYVRSSSTEMPSSQRRRIDGAFKAPQRNAALHGTKTEGDVDVDDGSVADLMEKDDTEKELERLVFGDQAGFYEALKSHGRRDDELQLARRRSGEGEEDGLSGEEDGLDALDDADV